MIRKFLFLFVALALTGCSRAPKDPAEVAYRRGVAHLEKGEYDLACAELDQALKLRPSYQDARDLRAVAGNKAILNPHKNEKITIAPAKTEEPAETVDQVFQRGMAFFETGNDSRAVLEFNRVNQRDPKNINAHLMRGKTYQRMGRVQLAVPALTEAINLAPNSAEAYRARAACLPFLNKLEEALADADKAVQLAPEVAEAYYVRAAIHNRSYRLAEAQDDLRKARQLEAEAAGRLAKAGGPSSGGEVATLPDPPPWTTSVAYSPDGKTLAVAGGITSGPGQVFLYELASGRQRTSLPGHTAVVRSMAFSRDGKLLATGGDDTTVRLWEVSTGSLLATLAGHDAEVLSVVFSPDGRLLASGGWDHTMRLWDVAGKRELTHFSLGSGIVQALAFSPDGKILASGGGFGEAVLQLWDVSRQQVLTQLQGHLKPIRLLAFSPDGTVLASGSHDRSIRLWELPSGKLRAKLLGHTHEIISLAFSPDGKTVVSAAEQSNEVLFWDTAAGRERRTLKTTPEEKFQAVALSPDGKQLATAGAVEGFASLKLWAVADKSANLVVRDPSEPAIPHVVTFRGHEDLIMAVAFSPDGRLLASGSHDHTIRLWDMAKNRLHATLQGDMDFINSLTFSPDGTTIGATNFHSKNIILWDVASGTRRAAFPGHGESIAQQCILPDGKTLAATYELGQTANPGAGDITLWDVASGKEKARFPLDAGAAEALAFSPDGMMLAVGSSEFIRQEGQPYPAKTGVAILWDLTAGKPRATLHHPGGPVQAVAFTRDGTTLGTGAWGGGIKLWNVAENKEIDMLDLNSATITSLAFSPDGRTLGIGTHLNSLCLCDRATKAVHEKVVGHSDRVESVAFSPDGKHLASGSRDGAVKVWDISSDPIAKPFDGPPPLSYPGPLNAVAFSPAGNQLALAGSAKSIVIWDLATRPMRSKTLSGHTWPVHGLAFSPDGKILASGGASEEPIPMKGEIKLWDPVSGKERQSFSRFFGGVASVEFSPDQKFLLTSYLGMSRVASFGMWQPAPCSAPWPVRRASKAQTFSPDGKTLATGGGNFIRLYDIPAEATSAKPPDNQLLSRRLLKGTNAWSSHLAFSPDGKLLVSGATAHSLSTLWDLTTGKERAMLTGFRPTFSPDGKTVATASNRGTLPRPQFWDTATGKPTLTLQSAHANPIICLAFSPDGKRLVTGATDGSVKLWNPSTGSEMRSLTD